MRSPRPRAAVPEAVPGRFEAAPPGHRFRLFLELWGPEWKAIREGKFDALERVVSLQEHRAMLDAIRERQIALSDSLGEKGAFVLDAVADAPFVTGMGNEHPLENGFAFLDPYGLPYLPGSSVKGVVRRAAEELAEAGEGGWDLLAVWWLFGFDATSPTSSEALAPERIAEDELRRFLLLAGAREEWLRGGVPLSALLGRQEVRNRLHIRGALGFWDVLPSPPENRLRVDIMNPHYGHYYQKGQPPGDWGDPNPIFYLTLPPGTRFRFVVRMEPTKELPSWLDGKWRSLVEAAFAHALSWLGFGAKTSLGYGLMRKDPEAEEERRKKAARARREEERRREEDEERRRREELESLEGVDRWVRELETASEPRVHEIFRELDGLSGDDRKRLAAALKGAYQRLGKWGKNASKRQKEKNKKIGAVLGGES